jgi:hypothetical protein
VSVSGRGTRHAADGSIETKIADAGKVVNAIYDALKANGLLVASGKKNKKRKSK